MRIHARMSANQTYDTQYFELEELGFTEEQWLAMSATEQENAVKEAIYNLPEQPYWMLDTFETQ